LHLNRRRGFKSNRKTDRKAQDKGKIAEGAKRLRERLELEGARTFGEYLWRRHGGSDGLATPRTRKAVRISPT
jgi:CRISPR-associated endonuclease Csn1